MDQLATYLFLLVIHNNYGPILYCFQKILILSLITSIITLRVAMFCDACEFFWQFAHHIVTKRRLPHDDVVRLCKMIKTNKILAEISITESSTLNSDVL